MRKKILFHLAFLFPFICYSQKQVNIWYFGNHAGLDFNYTPPAPLLNGQTDFAHAGMLWNEGCSSVSDSSGTLLFYTNGEKVWNQIHQIMPNGSGLMGHSSSTQSSIIIPKPGSSRFFYLFTTDASENNFQAGLRYSKVDMCLDGVLGDVISNEINVKLLDSVTEKLISIKHSNGNDYWIITHKNNSDKFYSVRLTSSGIVDTVISNTGPIDANVSGATGGQMVSSPNGLKLAYAKPSALNGFTLIADFDPSTGIVSNGQSLTTNGTEYAVAFSANNSKLYFSTVGHREIYQYDLNAGNISAIIASKTFIFSSGPDGWEGMQLAPDGRIYISRAGKGYLSAIEYPDSLCPSCNYIDSAVYLGGQKASFGLPNFIAGYNYSNTSYDCSSSVNDISIAESISVFPNPTAGSFSIRSSSEYQSISIYNSLGELVYENKKPSKNQEIDLDKQHTGVYFCRVKFEGGEKILKIVKTD